MPLSSVVDKDEYICVLDSSLTMLNLGPNLNPQRASARIIPPLAIQLGSPINVVAAGVVTPPL